MTTATDPAAPAAPRWVTALFGAAVVVLVPWTLWLTMSLPSHHVTRHYDLAWVGFDVALLAVFASLVWATVRASRWLAPLAAVAATMLVCDAWFDVTTSAGGGELVEAVLEAAFVELPLAAICAFVVYDAETFVRVARRR